mmetsp:Transcript_21638/g.72791  ORF Transcript_21638/g.72791 Transcript_21638/m.72791 type:complete len:247 (+) Transcript_21638:315-1055(+)
MSTAQSSSAHARVGVGAGARANFAASCSAVQPWASEACGSARALSSTSAVVRRRSSGSLPALLIGTESAKQWSGVMPCARAFTAAAHLERSSAVESAAAAAALRCTGSLLASLRSSTFAWACTRHATISFSPADAARCTAASRPLVRAFRSAPRAMSELTQVTQPASTATWSWDRRRYRMRVRDPSAGAPAWSKDDTQRQWSSRCGRALRALATGVSPVRFLAGERSAPNSRRRSTAALYPAAQAA